jgi:hypothetical protein
MFKKLFEKLHRLWLSFVFSTPYDKVKIHDAGTTGKSDTKGESTSSAIPPISEILASNNSTSGDMTPPQAIKKDKSKWTKEETIGYLGLLMGEIHSATGDRRVLVDLDGGKVLKNLEKTMNYVMSSEPKKSKKTNKKKANHGRK